MVRIVGSDSESSVLPGTALDIPNTKGAMKGYIK